MIPRADWFIQLREARHAEVWDDLLRRIREARAKAVRPIEGRKEVRT